MADEKEVNLWEIVLNANHLKYILGGIVNTLEDMDINSASSVDTLK